MLQNRSNVLHKTGDSWEPQIDDSCKPKARVIGAIIAGLLGGTLQLCKRTYTISNNMTLWVTVSRSKPQTNLGCSFLASGAKAGRGGAESLRDSKMEKKKQSQCDIGHFLCTVKLYAQRVFKRKVSFAKTESEAGHSRIHSQS